jgi:hypothetical protein
MFGFFLFLSRSLNTIGLPNYFEWATYSFATGFKKLHGINAAHLPQT